MRWPRLAEDVDQLVVVFVNLFAQGVDALRGRHLLTDHQLVEDEVQHVGRHLLLGIAPGLVGIAVTLHNQSVHTQVHGLLTERSNQVATAADVAGVVDNGQIGITALQLNGQLPHGQIAVNLVVDAGEAAMDSTKTLDAGAVDALQSTHPELDVGIDGVLHEDGNVHTLERIGYGLNGKGIGRRAGTDPQDVDAVLETKLNVLRRSHFRSDEHACLLLDALHPRQRLLAVALEASGLRAGLPDAGTKHVASFGGKLQGRLHHLLFGFGRTGTADDNGTGQVTGQIQGFEFQIHNGMIIYCLLYD